MIVEASTEVTGKIFHREAVFEIIHSQADYNSTLLQVLKLVPSCSAAILLLGIAHYLQNHVRYVRRQLGPRLRSSYSFPGVLCKA